MQEARRVAVQTHLHDLFRLIGIEHASAAAEAATNAASVARYATANDGPDFGRDVTFPQLEGIRSRADVARSAVADLGDVLSILALRNGRDGQNPDEARLARAVHTAYEIVQGVIESVDEAMRIADLS